MIYEKHDMWHVVVTFGGPAKQKPKRFKFTPFGVSTTSVYVCVYAFVFVCVYMYIHIYICVCVALHIVGHRVQCVCEIMDEDIQ